jgi:hypothetical protein
VHKCDNRFHGDPNPSQRKYHSFSYVGKTS